MSCGVCGGDQQDVVTWAKGGHGHLCLLDRHANQGIAGAGDLRTGDGLRREQGASLEVRGGVLPHKGGNVQPRHWLQGRVVHHLDLHEIG